MSIGNNKEEHNSPKMEDNTGSKNPKKLIALLSPNHKAYFSRHFPRVGRSPFQGFRFPHS